MTTQAVPYFIRCRAPEEKRAKLLDPAGRLTSRRVYAARIPGDRVEGCLAELREQNPGWIFSAVRV